MRTFTSSHAFSHNNAWRDAMDAERHIVQFPLLVVAKTKKAAIEVLVEMGETQRAAESLVKGVTAATRLGTSWEMLVEMGVIDLGEPGIYFSDGSSRGSKVIRVTSSTSADVLGEFGYDGVYGGRGPYFIPA